MRDAFAAELATLADEDEGVMFLTGDLGFGVFEPFARAHPKQYLNVGVAEQNMIAIATGLALEGRTVFAYSIGNFPVLRCLEQIRNDAAYHGANVKIVSIGGGFSYGPLGMSHHATEDLAVMRATPEVTTYVPGTVEEVGHCVRAIAAERGTCYLRLDKSAGVEVDTAEPFTNGHWRVMSAGHDVGLVASGGVLREAQIAAMTLKEHGLSVRVVNANQLSISDPEIILASLGPVRAVVTVEEHTVVGGLGGLVAETLAEAHGGGIRLVRCGIRTGYVSVVGSQQYLREVTGTDADAIVGVVVKLKELGIT